jgi:hypothetical protein
VETTGNSDIYSTFYNNENNNNHFTPWSRVLLEKLMIAEMFKKIPVFYGP